MPDLSPETIPLELRERDQWLLWSADSEPPKKPLNADGYDASWTDPGQWMSFDKAYDLAENKDQFDGVGFVVAEKDPYIGLDLDSCLREPNAPKPKEWLPSLSRFTDTWMEYSVSGTGIHVFTKGDRLPDWWTDSHFTDSEHEGVEAYTEKFFVMTGSQLEIAADDITEVDVDPFLSDAFEAVNGDPVELPGTPDAGNTDTEIGVYDVISHGSYPEGENTGHPFHPSETGTNFRVDNGGETWRCWRHGVTGNGAHLLGIEQGVIECGDWANGGLSSDTWRDIFDAGRDGGYDIAEPQSQSRPASDGEPPDPPSDEDGEPGPVDWDYVRERYQEDGPSWGRFYAARALEDRYDWMYVVESERLWVYDDTAGYFDPWGEEFAAKILERNLNSYYRKAEKSEVLDRLQARNQTHRETLNARARDGYYLCVGNGVVDLKTGELKDHSPYYKFTRGLRWDYDPAQADPEPVLEFLDDITERKADRDTLLDHLAHGLMPGHPYRAFVITYGPGSNGKTQMGKLFRGFVGEDNAASVELQDLTGDDEFATGGLPGAFVNVGDDISVSEIRDASILKSLTGGGTVRANEKFEKKFEFENEAAMFFSANEPPRISEESDAVGDRLYPIQMPYRFLNENDSEYDPDNEYHKLKEPGIADTLLEDAAAMRGLLLLSVAHAQELIESNGRYSMPEGPAERRARYEAASDPIRRFALEYFEQGDQDDIILKDDAYDVYAQMCSVQDERVASGDIFKRQVSQLPLLDIESARTRQLTPGDSAERCWRYLTFKDKAKELMSARLHERYFPDDDTEQESFDADTDAFGATPLLEAADASTGYVAITAEVVDTHEIADGDGLRAILRDESGAMDIKTWEQTWITRLQKAEGKAVALQNVEVFTDDYDDTRKLAPVPGLTEIAEIQPGVGYAPDADTEEGQDRLSDLPDDARGPQANAKRVRAIVEQHGGTLSKSALVEKASMQVDGMDPQTAEHALETALQKGMLQRGGDGVETT